VKISHNPSAAIEQCLTWQHLQQGGIDTTTPTDYAPSSGKRYRVTHDKKTGNIKVIPWVRHDTKSTRTGRRSTTDKVGDGMEVGKILSAAFGKRQAPQHALLLRFMYDPDFIKEKKCQEARRWFRLWVATEVCQLFPDSVGVVRRRNIVGVIWELCMNFNWYVRMGSPKFSDYYLSQAMGFANKTQANWGRDYKPLIGMVMCWLQAQENEAVSPVLDALDKLHDEHEENAVVLRFSKTLTIRKGVLAS